MKHFILFVIFFQTILITHTQAQQPVDDNWLRSAEINFRQNNYEFALRDYNNHIENHPSDPIAYLYRARVYEALGRQTESKMDVKVAQRLNPLSLMHISPEMRSKYTANKSYEYDYSDLKASFIKSPSNLDTYNKIFAELENGHSQDSLIQEVIQVLAEKDISNAQRILLDIEITALNKAIIFDLQGKIYLKKLEYENAINSFTEAIKANPKLSIAYHNRSICHKLNGDYDKAEADLNQAINLNDDISLFYFTYAKLNEKKGQNQIAMDYYSKAIEMDKEYEEAIINYSQLLKGLGDYTTGLKLLNEAINNNEDINQNKFFLANLHFVYGDFDKAIDEYDDFLSNHPDDKDALYNLGLSKILVRNIEEGCSDIENSLDLEESKKRREVHNLFCNSLSF